MRPGVQEPSVVAEDTVIGDLALVGSFCVLGMDGPDPPLVIGPGATIRSQTVIYRATTIGTNFHAGHGVLVRESTTIGNDVSVGSHSVVEHHVRMSDGVRLHSGCFVPEYSELEAHAWLGPGVIVTNARYPNRPDTKDHLEGVRIGQDAVVGAGAVLLPGVSIGAGAIIGAGAVIVHDVTAGQTVVGNPARTVGPRR
jgi:acetyltransferase-like isoleucine patch superfamily enzyme